MSILTNLLYFKDEVIAAFICSLLNKSESAIFWAYEIHYSGFNDELFDLLEKIYYYFFATLNPNFKKFLIRNLLKWRETQDNQIINKVVSNLLIRPYNLDVFILVQISKSVKVPDHFDGNLDHLIEGKKYGTLSKYILHSCSDEQFEKLCGEYKTKTRIELLAQLMQKCTAKKFIKIGDKLYLESEYIQPEIGEEPEPVLYKILENYCKYGVNEIGFLGAFQLKRPKDMKKVQELWRSKWLYYACGSPVWLERVESYGGSLDNEKNTVVFENEEQEDAFHDNFGLEPDEQKRETQEKIIPTIQDVKASEFYERFKGEKGIYNISKNILEKIKKIII
jgi:hypothetical protein